MATYSKTNYNSENYAKYRPTYPDSLFQHLQEYIGRPVEKAVDLGCGSGQATQAIAKFAKHVTGLDPSAPMIKEAPTLPNVDWKVASDADITEVVPSHTVDLITVAEAFHWTELPELWSRIHSILKPGGVLAIFSYYLFNFVDYPESGRIIADFSLGQDKCGPYWDKNQSRLNNLYEEIEVPPQLFGDVVREINPNHKLVPNHPFELVQRNVPVRQTINLLNTWSAYHNWKRMNPDKPDLVEETERELLSATNLSLDSKVTVKFNSVYIFARAI